MHLPFSPVYLPISHHTDSTNRGLHGEPMQTILMDALCRGFGHQLLLYVHGQVNALHRLTDLAIFVKHSILLPTLLAMMILSDLSELACIGYLKYVRKTLAAERVTTRMD
ncbi:unnamed protein product [Taenia asiatica]|uniref:Uncharacterized protein n=1 Tax=Taenia asiatica TaxID=60517 RepID=A0A0R3VVX8_TAEAS|nr:unnamed protein product [Taenia asiatica]